MEVRKETGRWKNRWRIRDLFADRRCSQAVLDFLTATDVGRIVPAAVEEDGAGSEASEWERRERREREEEGSGGGGAGGRGRAGAGGDTPLFLRTPSFMASAEEE